MSEKLSGYQHRGLESSGLRTPETGKPKHECGVFGLYHHSLKEVMDQHLFRGAFLNQHRGEESAGIAVSDGMAVSKPYKKRGLVSHVVREYKTAIEKGDTEKRLGHIGVAHVRYSTTGGSQRENAGPFYSDGPGGRVIVSHNGNITNYETLREKLESDGYEFQGTTDTEIIAALIANAPGETMDQKIPYALRKLKGSFSLAILTKDALYAACDEMANRPLHYREIDIDGVKGYAVSSETPALDAGYGRGTETRVKRGQLIKFDNEGVRTSKFIENGLEELGGLCGMEIAYLMRADGRLNGTSVDKIRRALGERLAQLDSVPDTVRFVTYIPESSKSAAEGYAEGLSKKFGRPVFVRTSMLKGRYERPSFNGDSGGGHRGFMQPDHEKRIEIAQQNYHPFPWIEGEDMVVLDDSIVRGTTTEGVIKKLRDYNPNSLHMRSIWDKVEYYCPFGTDIKKTDTLIGANRSNEEIASKLDADSVGYLPTTEFINTASEVLGQEIGLCTGCSTGTYPQEIPTLQIRKKVRS